MIKNERLIQEILNHFPEPKVELRYKNPWQLYVSVVLSAQCTDKTVNETTKELFSKYPDYESFLDLENEDLEKIIYSTGFYKNKAKTILNAARFLHEKHKGMLPSKMDELLRVPGLGRKSANVILSTLYEKNEGIVVDTHVMRVSQRLGITTSKDPVKIERDLMEYFHKNQWSTVSIGLVLFGRYICKAKKPDCEKCGLKASCNYFMGKSSK